MMRPPLQVCSLARMSLQQNKEPSSLRQASSAPAHRRPRTRYVHVDITDETPRNRFYKP